jgi:hypothetical protein
MANNTEKYDQALEMGMKVVPQGEEVKGTYVGTQEFGLLYTCLRRYVFGWLVNMLSNSPQTYTILLTDKSVVLIAYKRTKILFSYDVEYTLVKKISEFEGKKKIGKYILSTTNNEGKEIKISVHNQGDWSAFERAFS